ncbi:MAG: GNAT family N-acetyltransferase [Spirochaetales bacterium]|nr:GNAT family N-acetyltransferase [Spirochaetales bacterium]
MNYYPIETDTFLLNPLYTPGALNQLRDLCRNNDFKQNSKVYTNELNLSDSMARIEKFASIELYWFHNRLFIILDKKSDSPIGMIGLKDIDWLEHRGEIISIMDNESIKRKVISGPLKLLLKNALNDWHILRIRTRLLSTDSYTMVVLKSFGFSLEGTLRKDLLIDGDYVDINILGLLKEEFHSMSEV